MENNSPFRGTKIKTPDFGATENASLANAVSFAELNLSILFLLTFSFLP